MKIVLDTGVEKREAPGDVENTKITANGKKLVRGAPWPKGYCPNPAGRPVSLSARIQKQTKDGEELVAIMLKIARGTLEVTNTTIGKDGESRDYTTSPSHRDRIAAVEWLTERGWGKVQSEVKVSNPDGTPITSLVDPIVTSMASEYLRNLLGRLSPHETPRPVEIESTPA